MNHRVYMEQKAVLGLISEKDRKETFPLSEVVSSLVGLRLVPSESVS